MSSKESKRIILRIEISQQAIRKFDEFLEETALTRVATSSRLLEWFARQDAEIQTTILGLHPLANVAELPTKILKRVIEETKKGRIDGAGGW
ncbi:MAG: hypothetical protein ABSF29_17175 [Tepidisphaeraceae bacterium]|jgi:hypothetical protein